jgi:hypothetical protein
LNFGFLRKRRRRRSLVKNLVKNANSLVDLLRRHRGCSGAGRCGQKNQRTGTNFIKLFAQEKAK